MKTSSYLRALSSLPFVAFRRSRVFAIFAAIVTTQAQAILDANSNALSDLWEKQHNNGNLLPNTFLATSDNDKDGWTNAKEAIAGTNPFEANPPDGIVALTITPSLIEGSYTLTWNTLVGKNYQLKVSTDLINWSNLGDPITTSQNTNTIGVNTNQPGTTIPPTVFWQINVTDLDIDNDGLTNAEEHSLGTNPFLDDTDGDTLKDKAEILAGTNPLDVDTDEDGLNDNLAATPLSNDATADPDGANLAAHLNNHTTATNGVRLIARYDFEALPIGANNDLPSSVPIIPAAMATNVGIDRFSNPSGMPSFTCQWNNAPTANEFLSLPHQILDDRTKHTWSYWLKLPKNAFVPSAQNSGVRSLLSVGINQYAPSYPGSSSPLPALHWYCDIATGMIRAETYQVQIGTPTMLGSGWNIPAAWNDGEWHHIILHKSDNNYKIYFDGVDLGNRSSNNINLPLSANSYTLIGRRDLTSTTATNTAFRFPPTTRLDRLRCYTTLTSADVLALYNQDVDCDGLFDRTESRIRLWNDRNQNTLREANESDYILRPFNHDNTDSDHDRDGIPSHNEQNGPIVSHPGNFDTDGDLLPDGWEKLHNLPYYNPAAPPNTHQDIDNDGASNFKEYLVSSNPLDPDTDDDGTYDGPEINQHSNATYPADQGQAPDLVQTYSLRLGVGDQSGSKSERYQLIVYEYDWSNHTETVVHRLSAQTYGDYVEETIPWLDPLSTYTFQIKWMGTNLGYNAPADFDYTFRVEPTDSNSFTSVTEVFDPQTGIFEPGSILGQKNNVTTFLISTEFKRVLAEKAIINLSMDYDMDGKIEALRIPFKESVAGLPVPYGPDESIQDKTLLESDPQRYCIIDINNNNTDFAGSGGTTVDIDNANNQLDTEEDREEMLNATTGHSFGKLRFWCTPISGYGMLWKGDTWRYDIKLSLVNPLEAQNVIRVFDWQQYNKDKGKPQMLLGPGKTEHILDPDEFFDEATFNDGRGYGPERWYHNFCVEGITYGTATIKIEIIDTHADPQIVKFTQTARVSVNVDQFSQAQAQVPTTKEAISLRGKKPHYFGAENPDAGGSVGLRAVRGRFIARLPSIKFNTSEFTQVTSMHTRKLRELNPASSSGASFWMGIKSETKGQLQWAQCGLRWLQNADGNFGGQPQAYLETGLQLSTDAKPYIDRYSAISSSGDTTLDGPTQTSRAPMLNWYQGTLDLSYILYKEPVSQSNGTDSTVVPWLCLIKDNRVIPPGPGLPFIRLQCAVPGPKNVPLSALEPYSKAYREQSMDHLQLMFETNQSEAFAPGKTESDQKGQISNVMVGSGLINNPSPMPSQTELADLWTWLNANVAWQDVPDMQNPGGGNNPPVKFTDITKIRDGKNDNGDAKEGTSPHPFWQKSIEGNGMQVWDLRNYGFGATYSN